MPLPAKAKIIRAAAELFAAHGYHAVSTRDVARRARVNETTIYRNFTDKRRLMDACLEQLTGAPVREPVLQALQAPDFRQAIHGFAERFTRALPPVVVRLTLTFGMELGGKATEDYVQSAILPLYRALEQTIEAQQRARQVRRADPYILARTLVNTLYGHLVSAAMFGPAWEQATHVRPEHVHNYVGMWLDGVLTASSRWRSKQPLA